MSDFSHIDTQGRVKGVVARPFTEAAAEASDLQIPRGCNLMEYFLTVR